MGLGCTLSSSIPMALPSLDWGPTWTPGSHHGIPANYRGHLGWVQALSRVQPKPPMPGLAICVYFFQEEGGKRKWGSVLLTWQEARYGCWGTSRTGERGLHLPQAGFQVGGV